MADRERGAALLTVLMIVAIVAVLAATALEKLRLSTRIAGNAGTTEQARGFAMAAEALALAKIGDLKAQNPSRTTLVGGWSGRPFALPLPDGGMATARVTDGGNCFNLNGLVTRAGAGLYASDPAARLRFAGLMRGIGIPAQVAEQVAGGAADWIDSDAEQQAGGAEDSFYLSRTPGYRTAGTLMIDPSELRAVSGVTSAVYAQLRRWVCTLPIAQAAPLNLNTLLPEQAPLLAALLPDTLSVGVAAQALNARPPQGFGTPGAFWAQPSLAALGPGAAESLTAVTSDWFTLDIDVALGTTTLEEHALIDATRLPARLASRQWGERP